ncbi:hypothetical protein JCM11251_004911 [Rhodosporidiobolus azoricus]
MARGRFFGSGRNVHSGAQPTFSAQGKAKGPKKGTKRAKPGGRVRRKDAFPEEGGRTLMNSSDEDADEMSSKGRVASAKCASRARAIAASSRFSYSRSSALTGDRHALPAGDLEGLDENDFAEVSDVSTHASDEEEVDSDDPDKEARRGGRQQRWVRKVKGRRALMVQETGDVKGKVQRLFREEADEEEEGEEEDEATRLRKARLARFDSAATSAPKNTGKGKTTVIDLMDSSDYDHLDFGPKILLPRPSPSFRRASSSLSLSGTSPGPSSPQQYPPAAQLWTRREGSAHSQTLLGLKKQRERERREAREAAKLAEKLSNGEVVVPPARKKQKGMGDGRGRRLCDSEGEGEAAMEIESLSAIGGGGRGSGGRGSEKGKGVKGKERERKKCKLFNRSCDEDDENYDTDFDHSRPSSPHSKSRSVHRATNASSSASSRAARRARTSQQDPSGFVNSSDEEDGEDGVVIDTGGTGGMGSFSLSGGKKTRKSEGKGQTKDSEQVRYGRDNQKGKKRIAPPLSSEDEVDHPADLEEEDQLASNAPSTDSDAPSRNVDLPAFRDPRLDLRRRRLRELTDPPTDAFSSSDGGGESSDEGRAGRRRRKEGKKSKEEEEWEKMERKMGEKKREYREKRGPGYSNPRRNCTLST